jgi:hypothetical protein
MNPFSVFAAEMDANRMKAVRVTVTKELDQVIYKYAAFLESG